MHIIKIIVMRLRMFYSDRRVGTCESELKALRTARARLAIDVQKAHMKAELDLIAIQKRITRAGQLESLRLDYHIKLAEQDLDDALEAAPILAPVIPITQNKAA